MEEIKNQEVLDTNKENKKKKNLLSIILETFFALLIAFGVIYSGLNIVDQKTGYKFAPFGVHTAVIVSDSMSFVNETNLTYLDANTPHIAKGDIIQAKPYSKFEDIKQLDVAIYLSDSGILVCHRVIDTYTENGDKFVILRGDANSANDTPVKYERIRGKVTNNLKGIGKVVLFFQSIYFLMALCFSCFFILLGYFIYNLKKEKVESKN